ncbi:ANTAR domain-containing response regulator [Candidatus Formimonas warabiya]|uniref:Stage 0 sporulation protein A homolog n=1 Tax=Formimonas warabiya TaxID=1761012 RepID=A0A3G1KS98_FORW1|nr:response regulator [Candidatus Formimonas warabiya]ATW25328.1 response regulator [Candidatus Formimonas warabiya]
MGKLSILIAEDEPLTRLDLKEMLEGAGYFVCGEANNGNKAVDLAKQLMPDLAILDIKMPGLDGLEVAKILHAMNIPVILLTAYSQQNFINRAEKVSVYSYLIKPITERELLPAVQLTYARWKEMQSVQKELKDTQTKLKSQKIIGHARALLAKQYNISDYEAHQQLVHEAMQYRITLVERASQILKETKREEPHH